MTFQSRSLLIKHGTTHSRQSQPNINTFLESFGASLENDMLGIDDDFESEGQSKSSDFDTRLGVDDPGVDSSYTYGSDDVGGDGTEGEILYDSAGAPLTGERLALQCDICQAR